MSARDRRVYARKYYEAPISYAKFNAKGFYEATMYNISEGGMYFETEDALMIGAPVYIRMINFSPEAYTPGSHKAFVAQVRWCRKIPETSVFGAGVQYMAKAHLNGIDMDSETSLCDLCGENTALTEIHETNDALGLCLDCFKRLGGLIDGKIKECIMRFATGNVI